MALDQQQAAFLASLMRPGAAGSLPAPSPRRAPPPGFTSLDAVHTRPVAPGLRAPPGLPGLDPASKLTMLTSTADGEAAGRAVLNFALGLHAGRAAGAAMDDSAAPAAAPVFAAPAMPPTAAAAARQVYESEPPTGDSLHSGTSTPLTSSLHRSMPAARTHSRILSPTDTQSEVASNESSMPASHTSPLLQALQAAPAPPMQQAHSVEAQYPTREEVLPVHATHVRFAVAPQPAQQMQAPAQVEQQAQASSYADVNGTYSRSMYPTYAAAPMATGYRYGEQPTSMMASARGGWSSGAQPQPQQYAAYGQQYSSGYDSSTAYGYDRGQGSEHAPSAAAREWRPPAAVQSAYGYAPPAAYPDPYRQAYVQGYGQASYSPAPDPSYAYRGAGGYPQAAPAPAPADASMSHAVADTAAAHAAAYQMPVVVMPGTDGGAAQYMPLRVLPVPAGLLQQGMQYDAGMYYAQQQQQQQYMAASAQAAADASYEQWNAAAAEYAASAQAAGSVDDPSLYMQQAAPAPAEPEEEPVDPVKAAAERERLSAQLAANEQSITLGETSAVLVCISKHVMGAREAVTVYLSGAPPARGEEYVGLFRTSSSENSRPIAMKPVTPPSALLHAAMQEEAAAGGPDATQLRPLGFFRHIVLTAPRQVGEFDVRVFHSAAVTAACMGRSAPVTVLVGAHEFGDAVARAHDALIMSLIEANLIGGSCADESRARPVLDRRDFFRSAGSGGSISVHDDAYGALPPFTGLSKTWQLMVQGDLATPGSAAPASRVKSPPMTIGHVKRIAAAVTAAREVLAYTQSVSLLHPKHRPAGAAVSSTSSGLKDVSRAESVASELTMEGDTIHVLWCLLRDARYAVHMCAWAAEMYMRRTMRLPQPMTGEGSMAVFNAFGTVLHAVEWAGASLVCANARSKGADTPVGAILAAADDAHVRLCADMVRTITHAHTEYSRMLHVSLDAGDHGICRALSAPKRSMLRAWQNAWDPLTHLLAPFPSELAPPTALHTTPVRTRAELRVWCEAKVVRHTAHALTCFAAFTALCDPSTTETGKLDEARQKQHVAALVDPSVLRTPPAEATTGLCQALNRVRAADHVTSHADAASLRFLRTLDGVEDMPVHADNAMCTAVEMTAQIMDASDTTRKLTHALIAWAVARGCHHVLTPYACALVVAAYSSSHGCGAALEYEAAHITDAHGITHMYQHAFVVGAAPTTNPGEHWLRMCAWLVSLDWHVCALSSNGNKEPLERKHAAEAMRACDPVRKAVNVLAAVTPATAQVLRHAFALSYLQCATACDQGASVDADEYGKLLWGKFGTALAEEPSADGTPAMRVDDGTARHGGAALKGMSQHAAPAGRPESYARAYGGHEHGGVLADASSRAYYSGAHTAQHMSATYGGSVYDNATGSGAYGASQFSY